MTKFKILVCLSAILIAWTDPQTKRVVSSAVSKLFDELLCKLPWMHVSAKPRTDIPLEKEESSAKVAQLQGTAPAPKETQDDTSLPNKFYTPEGINERVQERIFRPEPQTQSSAQRSRYLDAMYADFEKTSKKRDPHMVLIDETDEPARSAAK